MHFMSIRRRSAERDYSRAKEILTLLQRSYNIREISQIPLSIVRIPWTFMSSSQHLYLPSAFPPSLRFGRLGISILSSPPPCKRQVHAYTDFVLICPKYTGQLIDSSRYSERPKPSRSPESLSPRLGPSDNQTRLLLRRQNDSLPKDESNSRLPIFLFLPLFELFCPCFHFPIAR
jgi:hypothetical protein